MPPRGQNEGRAPGAPRKGTPWVWNDYLLPYLTLDLNKYKTISVAIQYLKGGYGSVDMGAMMGCLVLAIMMSILRVAVCPAESAAPIVTTGMLVTSMRMLMTIA